MPARSQQPTDSASTDACRPDGLAPEREDFAHFVAVVEPRLRRGLAGWCGAEAHDATAEALAWAWENWERVQI